MFRARTIGATFQIGLTHAELAHACAYLTSVNRRYLRMNPDTPTMRESGVRYQADPPGEELWLSIPDVLARGVGDCKKLAAWLAAVLQEKGIRAKCLPTTKDGIRWHIVVRMPDGTTVDPSIALGMNQ